METAEDLRLTPENWLDAALAAFEKGGVDAVKIVPLAKTLGVTRGSFYWHFQDRNELLRRLMVRWEALDTRNIIDAVESAGGTASERLLRLLETCARDEGKLEMALRAWANSDTRAGAAVAKVDKRRVNYIADLLEACGQKPEKAVLRARIAYSAWLGEYSQRATPSFKVRLENMRNLHRLILVVDA